MKNVHDRLILILLFYFGFVYDNTANTYNLSDHYDRRFKSWGNDIKKYEYLNYIFQSLKISKDTNTMNQIYSIFISEKENCIISIYMYYNSIFELYKLLC